MKSIGEKKMVADVKILNRKTSEEFEGKILMKGGNWSLIEFNGQVECFLNDGFNAQIGISTYCITKKNPSYHLAVHMSKDDFFSQWINAPEPSKARVDLAIPGEDRTAKTTWEYLCECGRRYEHAHNAAECGSNFTIVKKDEVEKIPTICKCEKRKLHLKLNPYRIFCKICDLPIK